MEKLVEGLAPSVVPLKLMPMPHAPSRLDAEAVAVMSVPTGSYVLEMLRLMLPDVADVEVPGGYGGLFGVPDVPG